MPARRLRPVPDPVAPGQESVWSFPRPPRIEPSTNHLEVRFGGTVIAKTDHALRVLETSQAPAYYFPTDDVDQARLEPALRTTLCEWKGTAHHADLVAGGRRAAEAAWSYQSPTAPYVSLRNMWAFYPARVDRCSIDGQEVRPQEGGFYGGWVTSKLAGPIKGAPGTEHW